MNVRDVEVGLAAFAQDHRHTASAGRDGWADVGPAVAGDDVPLAGLDVVREDVGVVEFVGSVGEPFAARPPRRRGDDGAVSGDGLRPVAIVVGHVNLTGVVGGFDLEGDLGPRDAARLGEREDHIVREGVGELALARAGVGFREEVILRAVGDEAFEPRAVGAVNEHLRLFGGDDGAPGDFEVEAQRAGDFTGEAADGNGDGRGWVRLAIDFEGGFLRWSDQRGGGGGNECGCELAAVQIHPVLRLALRLKSMLKVRCDSRKLAGKGSN